MLLKPLPGRLKIALASPPFPPSAEEVEAERKAKVARWKRKAAALQHLMNLQPDRARGKHLLPVGIQDGSFMSNRVQRQPRQIL